MDRTRIDQLSPRERECLGLVARGFSSKEIGKRLGISPHTVDGHLRHALLVLEVATRRDAARLFSESEHADAHPPQPLSAQLPPLAATSGPDPHLPPDRTGRWLGRLPLPVRGKGVRNNDLIVGQRLAWILGGAVLILLGLGWLAQGMDAVQSIFRGRP